MHAELRDYLRQPLTGHTLVAADRSAPMTLVDLEQWREVAPQWGSARQGRSLALATASCSSGRSLDSGVELAESAGDKLGLQWPPHPQFRGGSCTELLGSMETYGRTVVLWLEIHASLVNGYGYELVHPINQICGRHWPVI